MTTESQELKQLAKEKITAYGGVITVDTVRIGFSSLIKIINDCAQAHSLKRLERFVENVKSEALGGKVHPSNIADGQRFEDALDSQLSKEKEEA